LSVIFEGSNEDYSSMTSTTSNTTNTRSLGSCSSSNSSSSNSSGSYMSINRTRKASIAMSRIEEEERKDSSAVQSDHTLTPSSSAQQQGTEHRRATRTTFDPEALSDLLFCGPKEGAAALLSEDVAKAAMSPARHPAKRQSLTKEDVRNPFSEELRARLLAGLPQPISARFAYCKTNRSLPAIKSKTQISLGEEVYHVRSQIGQGAYAKVFLATTCDPMNVTMMPDNDEDLDEKNTMVLKVQKPACPWEVYACHEVRERVRPLGSPAMDALMRINRAYLYASGSVLVTQYHRPGTLLDVLNRYKKAGEHVSEQTAMYLMLEVLTILQNLHNSEMIHADVKPDNFIVQAPPCSSLDCLSPPSSLRGLPPSLKLIDFGRAIDMRLLPAGAVFTHTITTSGFTTPEMTEGRPWTYQVDYYGAASVAHMLLWNTYLSPAKRGGEWAPCSVYQRYRRHQPLWRNMFSQLLNAPSCLAPSPLPALIDALEGALKGGWKEAREGVRQWGKFVQQA